MPSGGGSDGNWRPVGTFVPAAGNQLSTMASPYSPSAAPPAPADADIVRASLDEPQSFAALFNRHFDAVHGYLRRRVGDGPAEELAAESFARAFDRRDRYDLRYADARPWLFGIAANLIRRYRRAERRRLDAYARAGSGSNGAGPEAGGISADLVNALLDLRAAEREALLLFAWADLSYEDIARALDVPVGTVRSRIGRARRRLRAELRPGATNRLSTTPKETIDA
ncbi:MAG: RNA polymerase sigma factor [Gaiellaceae bacterium]